MVLTVLAKILRLLSRLSPEQRDEVMRSLQATLYPATEATTETGNAARCRPQARATQGPSRRVARPGRRHAYPGRRRVARRVATRVARPAYSGRRRVARSSSFSCS